MGWAPITGFEGKCEVGLGEMWSPKGIVPDEHSPLWLYFTPESAGGQASGSAILFINHIAKEKQKLIDEGYIIPSPFGDGSGSPYYVAVGFRDNGDACATSGPSSYTLGDRLVINPEGVARSLPLTVSDAANEGWFKGSCFAGMGTHWFLDLSL